MVPAPSQPATSEDYRVRLLPIPAGKWSSAQRVLWLLPRISCATGGTETVKVRPLLTEAHAEATDNWQRLEVDIVAVPSIPSVPKRLAPSLTWAPAYHFAPNETAAGLAHSVQMFRNVGMTTIPQSGSRNLEPSGRLGAQLFTPEQRQTKLWDGLKVSRILCMLGCVAAALHTLYGLLIAVRCCFSTGRKSAASTPVSTGSVRTPLFKWQERLCQDKLRTDISSHRSDWTGSQGCLRLSK